MKKDSFQKGEIIIYKTSKNEVAFGCAAGRRNGLLDAHQISKLFVVTIDRQ